MDYHIAKEDIIIGYKKVWNFSQINSNDKSIEYLKKIYL